jgi:hypothetical protein
MHVLGSPPDAGAALMAEHRLERARAAAISSPAWPMLSLARPPRGRTEVHRRKFLDELGKTGTSMMGKVAELQGDVARTHDDISVKMEVGASEAGDYRAVYVWAGERPIAMIPHPRNRSGRIGNP